MQQISQEQSTSMYAADQSATVIAPVWIQQISQEQSYHQNVCRSVRNSHTTCMYASDHSEAGILLICMQISQEQSYHLYVCRSARSSCTTYMYAAADQWGAVIPPICMQISQEQSYHQYVGGIPCLTNYILTCSYCTVSSQQYWAVGVSLVSSTIYPHVAIVQSVVNSTGLWGHPLSHKQYTHM